MTARIILVLVMFAIAGICVVLRAIGPSKGAHATPRGYIHDDDMPTAVIPRAATEHAPPWEPVIEPAAIMAAPVPEPEPEPGAYWLAAGTVSADGQVRTVRVELLPPVEELLGHASTGDAVAAMSAGWHSVESLFNGHHVRQVRALTDGAP